MSTNARHIALHLIWTGLLQRGVEASQESHQHHMPGDDHVDGDGPLEAPGRFTLPRLHMTAYLWHTMPAPHPPPQAVPRQVALSPQSRSALCRGQQKTLDRRDPRWCLLFEHMDNPQRDWVLVAVVRPRAEADPLVAQHPFRPVASLFGAILLLVPLGPRPPPGDKETKPRLGPLGRVEELAARRGSNISDEAAASGRYPSPRLPRESL